MKKSSSGENWKLSQLGTTLEKVSGNISEEERVDQDAK